MANPERIRIGRHGLLLGWLALAWLAWASPAWATPAYPWLEREGVASTLGERFAPPAGFVRLATPAGSFAAWLRELPLELDRSLVHLHDGAPKRDQSVHAAVIAIDTGERDLQQCADAVIRLRAEYLFSRGCFDGIVFNFTSGDPAAWSEFARGMRAIVGGNRVRWERLAAPDTTYRSFRRYLDLVFTYAGTASLRAELRTVSDPLQVGAGDVFVEAWGHAALVLDVAENHLGERVFLLGQSYMPAQDLHVLRNPRSPDSAWYRARSAGVLETPEWSFKLTDLRRFPPAGCDRGEPAAGAPPSQ